MIWLLTLAWASPTGLLKGSVEPIVTLLPAGAALQADPAPLVDLTPAGCGAKAVFDGVAVAEGALTVAACAEGVFVRWSAGEVRVPEALPPGALAGVRVRQGPDGEVLVAVWSEDLALRTSAFSLVGASGWTLGERVLPAGPPLPWPELGVPTAEVRVRIDARLPGGFTLTGARVEAESLVLLGTVPLGREARPAEVRVERGPRLKEAGAAAP